MPAIEGEEMAISSEDEDHHEEREGATSMRNRR